MTCVLHNVRAHLCLASPLVLNSSGMSTTLSPCDLITTCSNTAKRHFPLSITWETACQASWSPRGLLPMVSQLPGERNCSRVTRWRSEGKETLEPNHPGPNLSPVCFLPVWLWPSYLAKLSLSFLLSFMRVIVGARELCQHLVAICCYESWVNECKRRAPAWQAVQGAGTLIQRTPRLVEFLPVMNSFPQAVSKGSASLSKAYCVSSAPSTHLVALTDLKMYPSCLPFSHFRTRCSPRGKKKLINTMH